MFIKALWTTSGLGQYHVGEVLNLFNRNILLLIASVFALAALSGCGKDEVIPPSAEAVKAERAVEAVKKMEAAYEARDMKGVLDPVSPDFRGGFAAFEAGVRKDIETFSKVALEIGMDRVVESGNEVSVSLHWNGRWWDSSGRASEGRGNAVFVFTDTGAMRLSSVTGDNPFAVVR